MPAMIDAESVRLASRPLRYEISVRRDARWQIIEVVNDGREKLSRPFDKRDLEVLEQRVRNIANEHLSKPGTEAVRVVQQRLRGDGDAIVADFHHADGSYREIEARRRANCEG